jgi:hypothetical protein
LNPFGTNGTKVSSKGNFAMYSRLISVILAIAATLAAVPVRAEDCPAKSNGMDDVIAAINAAPGCDRAMKVFEVCALGASGDVQFGEAVEQKCESGFLAKLKPPQKRAYDKDMRICDRKYRSESGTMYVSFTAFCRAKIAQRYAKQAPKIAR